MTPTRELAQEFAALTRAGVPVADAAGYFVPADLPEGSRAAAARRIAETWPGHPLVTEALAALDGGQWHRLSEPEQQSAALKKHYAEMAYFVMTNNFAEASGGTLAKLNTCRDVLEKKLAGNAGKVDPLTQYLQDAMAKFAAAKTAEAPEAPVH